MRFRRWPRVTVFEATPLKRAGLERFQCRQRDKLPLLADLIAETQPSADEEMARRAEYWPKLQQKERDDLAKLWRRARKRLFEYHLPLRNTIRSIWQGCPYPADPVYLLDLLHQADMGNMDPIGGPGFTSSRLLRLSHPTRPASKRRSGRSVTRRSAAVPRPPRLTNSCSAVIWGRGC